MSEATRPTRRRWFSYSLRMLLVVVTVIAAFLAYHVNWIRDRHRFLLYVDRSGQFGSFRRPPNKQSPQAPGLLWLFGERSQDVLVVSVSHETPDKLTQRSMDLLKTAIRLFPEAELGTVYIDSAGRAQFKPARGFGL